MNAYLIGLALGAVLGIVWWTAFYALRNRRRKASAERQWAGPGSWRILTIEGDADDGNELIAIRKIERSLEGMERVHVVHVAAPLVRRVDTLSDGRKVTRYAITVLVTGR